MLIPFVIAALVTLVGLRLAARSLVQRAAPDFTLGVAVAVLQPGIVVLGHGLQNNKPELYAVGLTCITAGTAAIALFAQLTFRARIGWARAVIALLIAFLCYGTGLLAYIVAIFVMPEEEYPSQAQAPYQP